MMRTVAVVALKGGSGKTTIAAHLALAAHLRGLKVLVADTDPQRSTMEVLGARATPGPETLAASGAGKDLMIVDTAAGALEDASEALVLADFAVVVVRPTLLDLHALARTMTLVSRLKKPFTVVVNQAQPAREGVEAPQVVRAMKALSYMRVSIAPVIVRARTIYQTALETGRTAEELQDAAAAREMAALWDYVDLRTEADEEEEALEGRA